MASTAASTSDQQPQPALQAPTFIERSGRQSPRPQFSSSKPSWIGPKSALRPSTPESSKMTEQIHIHYSHPGLQPPVFIAGSMCDPQWEPVEMTHTQAEDGELGFEHDFRAEPGQYQYKFRLGHGDWWVLDESKPIVDDGAGNRNNLLVVESEPAKSKDTDAPASHETQQTQEKEASSAPKVVFSNIVKVSHDEDERVPENKTNLFKHETMQRDSGIGQDEAEDIVEGEDDADDEEPPLLEHEAGPFKRVDSKNITPLKTDNLYFGSPAVVSPAEFEVEADDAFADDERDAPCPLFRHETGAAVDTDPEEAPLFRHETMSPVESPSMGSHSPKVSKRRPLDTQDVNDPSLEHFPTDEAGIFAQLQRAETRTRDDDVVFEGTPLSPSLAQSKSFSPQPTPAALNAESSDLSHLDSIDEAEETDEDATDEAAAKPVEKKDSVIEPVPIAIKVQDVSEIDDKSLITSTPEVSNRGPPTPPITPTEHAQDKAAPHDGPADTDDVVRDSTDDSPRFQSRNRQTNKTDNFENRDTSSPSEGEMRYSLMSNFWSWFTSICGGQGRAAGVAIAMGVAAAAIAINVRSA